MTVQIIRPRTRIAFSYFSISTYSFGLCAMNGSPGPNRMTLVSGSFSARMDASVKKLIPVVFIPDFPADQHFRRLSAHLFRRLPDRGQRNLEKRVHEDVVVSDHGNVFRNMESLLLYPLHGPDRHHIVEREDGIRPVRHAENPLRRKHAALERILSFIQQLRPERDSVFAERPSVPFQPLLGINQIPRTGDARDSAKAARQQIVRREIAALHMIDAYNPTHIRVNIPVRQKIRNMRLLQKGNAFLRHLRRALRRHAEDDAARARVRQHSEVDHIRLVAVVRIAQDHIPVIFLAFILHASREGCEEIIPDVGDGQPDRIR